MKVGAMFHEFKVDLRQIRNWEKLFLHAGNSENIGRPIKGTAQKTTHPSCARAVFHAGRKSSGPNSTKGRAIDAQVLSFRRMAYRVFNEVGGFTRRHISPSGRSMLIYRIIQELKDNLNYFGKVADNPVS